MTKIYHLDPSHSRVGFGVKHLMVATVRGRFGEAEADVITDGDDLSRATIVARIKTASIDTGDQARDGHLRSDDFFSAERYPEITFSSSAITPVGEDRYRVSGELTIRDVTRPVDLDATVEGALRDPWGNDRIAVTLTGRIDRKAWGLSWNQVLEAGRLLVSDDVKLEIEAVLVSKAAATEIAA